MILKTLSFSSLLGVSVSRTNELVALVPNSLLLSRSWWVTPSPAVVFVFFSSLLCQQEPGNMVGIPYGQSCLGGRGCLRLCIVIKSVFALSVVHFGSCVRFPLVFSFLRASLSVGKFVEISYDRPRSHLNFDSMKS